MQINPQLREALRQFRCDNHLRQDEAAMLASMSAVYLRKLESGDRAQAPESTVLALALAVGVQPIVLKIVTGDRDLAAELARDRVLTDLNGLRSALVEEKCDVSDDQLRQIQRAILRRSHAARKAAAQYE